MANSGQTPRSGARPDLRRQRGRASPHSRPARVDIRPACAARRCLCRPRFSCRIPAIMPRCTAFCSASSRSMAPGFDVPFDTIKTISFSRRPNLHRMLIIRVAGSKSILPMYSLNGGEKIPAVRAGWQPCHEPSRASKHPPHQMPPGGLCWNAPRECRRGLRR